MSLLPFNQMTYCAPTAIAKIFPFWKMPSTTTGRHWMRKYSLWRIPGGNTSPAAGLPSWHCPQMLCHLVSTHDPDSAGVGYDPQIKRTAHRALHSFQRSDFLWRTCRFFRDYPLIWRCSLFRIHQKFKPNPDIYQHLFDTFSLNPSDCFFMDDKPENIKAAQKLGMNGMVFTGENLSEIKHAIGLEE